MSYDQKPKGFTLIELMVTVAIMGIMAAIAFPSMGNFISNTRLTNRSQQTANLFRFAKSEAVRMGVPVVICGVLVRKDGRHSGVCNSANIASGMMAYADNDRDGMYTANTDTVLRTVNINGNENPALMKVEIQTCNFAGANCTVNANNKNEYIFMPNGLFGYKAATTTTRANLMAQVRMAQAFIRVSITDVKRSSLPARFVVVSPSGSATTCKAGDTGYQTFDSNAANAADRICKAA